MMISSPIPRNSSRLLLLVAVISLVLLWACRLPRLCIFDHKVYQCGGQNEQKLLFHPIQLPSSPPTISNHKDTSDTSLITTPPIDLSSPSAPFIAWPLARLCAEIPTTRWTEGLVFLCDNNSGGVGNIRNFILTCVRYAIEAGATGIVLPTIQTRSEERLDDLFRGAKKPLGWFFDEGVFREGVEGACPRVKVWDKAEDVPGVLNDEEKEGMSLQQQWNSGEIRPDMLTPNHLGMRGGCDQRDLNRHADLFGPRLHAWLRDKQLKFGREPVSKENPKLIRFNWGVQWTYPIYRDGPEFVATFGGLLRLREDVLALGERVVGRMKERIALATMAKAKARGDEEIGQGKGKKEEKEEYSENVSFVGIHLRTESDALSAWPSYETQAGAFLARTEAWFNSSGANFGSGSDSNNTGATAAASPRFVYLATGDAAEAARLAAMFAQAEPPIHVLTKNDLLTSGDDTATNGRKKRDEQSDTATISPSSSLLTLEEELKALSWDQQALVDFVVLLQSNYFLGISPSSFSMNVALKRHLQREGLYTRPWKVGVEEGDGRSWLVGKYEAYWDDWLFMYDSLWP